LNFGIKAKAATDNQIRIFLIMYFAPREAA
jgi:hypothetical protein